MWCVDVPQACASLYTKCIFASVLVLGVVRAKAYSKKSYLENSQPFKSKEKFITHAQNAVASNNRPS